jgi:hypothetical protein
MDTDELREVLARPELRECIEVEVVLRGDVYEIESVDIIGNRLVITIEEE